MYLLGPLYQAVEARYAARIAHFPLIRLIFYSLDKTLIYFLLFLCVRLVYLHLRQPKRRIHWGHELLLWLFIFYLLLLLALTVFRRIYFPWQLHFYWQRSPSVINLTPLTETMKLQYGQSIVDFLYNFYGNILWFIPFGLLWPWLHRRRVGVFKTTFCGFFLSILIETTQFFLATGVTDIDDVIFNTIGTIIGYLLYRLLVHPWRNRFHRRAS